MKSITLIKYGFPIAFIVAIVLSYTAKNNFTSEFDNQIGVMSADTIDKIELINFVESELVNPFMKERIKTVNEDKKSCIHHDFRIMYDYPEKVFLPIYKGEMINGLVEETNCDGIFRLYSVRIYYEEKRIIVRNSFLNKWATPEEYISNFKRKQEKMNID